MEAMVAAPEPELVICTLRAEDAPTTTLPKSSDMGVTERLDVLDTAASEMNSSEVVALDEISIALT